MLNLDAALQYSNSNSNSQDIKTIFLIIKVFCNHRMLDDSYGYLGSYSFKLYEEFFEYWIAYIFSLKVVEKVRSHV